MEIITELQGRELVAQMTGDGELAGHLCEEPRTLYAGFDPTADSLHIGSLVPLLALRRFQLAGHRPVALVGGATGLVGDPSFKAQERKLNSAEVVQQWTESIRVQVSKFVDFDDGDCSARVVNNLDWMGNMSMLDFLRDVGKHFSVNAMIHKESVRQRIERDDAGISFTEFSYMLMQSYDFVELNRRYNCTLQIGGSDQWGNITGGVDLARRMNGARVYGLTLPLVVKSDGSKFGKTETGTVWLDPAKTSPYSFYQFWMNTADADAYRFLKYFTFLPLAEIAEIERTDNGAGGRKSAQGILAREATRLVHGDYGLKAAERITTTLFSGAIEELSEQDLEQLKLDGMPSSTLDRDQFSYKSLTMLLTEAGLAPSGKQVKDALGRSAVLINNQPKSMADNSTPIASFADERALYGRFFVVRLGKKKYHLFELAR